MNCKQLAEEDVRRLCDRAREVLQDESNVQPVVCVSSGRPLSWRIGRYQSPRVLLILTTPVAVEMPSDRLR
jgi:hypothetical protein